MELRDINDNTPQFRNINDNIPLLQGSISVSEGIRPSSIILTVSATDDDTTSTVSYLITPNG